jgi:tRNA (cytidine/uridine-2'-O-)-methyltransferase
MRLALYEPDIPQNCGTILRLCACLGVEVDIIEPCGFVFSDVRLRRAGLDYLPLAAYRRHDSFTAFCRCLAGRCILLTTKASFPHMHYTFLRSDTLLFGSEGAGVPLHVHERADARLLVPMKPGMRSLNIAVCAGLVLGEALRQTKGFPETANNSSPVEQNEYPA